ncbi:MAG: XylR family transcriptional regulator [Verrucomicrobiae bacterium]
MKATLQRTRILLLVESSSICGRQTLEGIGRFNHDHRQWSFVFREQGLGELSLRELNQMRVDGVISRLNTLRSVRLLRDSGLPMVDLYGHIKTGKSQVTLDEKALARMAAEHFLERNINNLGFFAMRNERWMQDRLAAFLDYLRALGHPCHSFLPSNRSSRKQDEASRLAEIITWLQSLPKPVGILCAADMEALALLDACQQAGIAVPDQVAVLGVDNDPVICSVSSPSLSSIETNAQRMGYEAASLLSRIMKGGKHSSSCLHFSPIEVVTRESTDFLAVADPAVVQAIRLIGQLACKGVGVSHIADHVLMCRRTLERRFKAVLGRTLKQEILRVKIEQAKMLLLQRNYPMKRICDLSGFTSLYDFSRAFRRETGSTPGQFRRLRNPGPHRL